MSGSSKLEDVEYEVQVKLGEMKELWQSTANYSGEQQRAARQELTRIEIDLDDTIFDLESAIREVPPNQRTSWLNRLNGYKAEFQRLKAAVVTGQIGHLMTNRYCHHLFHLPQTAR